MLLTAWFVYLQIRVFKMARRALSEAELQKILESEEFFEDLLVFQNSNTTNLEHNTEPDLAVEPMAVENFSPQINLDQTDKNEQIILNLQGKNFFYTFCSKHPLRHNFSTYIMYLHNMKNSCARFFNICR